MGSKILQLLIFFIFSCCIASSQLNNNEFFSDKYKSSYFFQNDYQPLYGAVDYCLTQGQILFSPMSNQEAKAVFNMIPPDVDAIWVGITGLHSSAYYNLEGHHERDFYWATVKPVRKPRIKLYRNGTYDDFSGRTYLPFICRKREKVHFISAEDIKQLRNRLTTIGYVYWKRYNAMYKYYPPEDMTVASIKCLSDGALLFIPNTEQEITDVFKIVKQDDGDDIWVGASSLFHQGYITHTGEVLNHIYREWAPGQPQKCKSCDFVSINRDGELETSTYKVKRPLVCKKKIPEVVERYDINKYKFCPDLQYYFMDASVYCNTFGHVLFYPKSKEELDWVFLHLPPHIDNIWIGVSSFLCDNFYTMEGEKFDNLTWNDNSNTKQFVSVFRNGSYHEMNNHNGLPFVCRKLEEANSVMNTRAFKMPFSKKGYVHWDEYNAMYKYNGVQSGFSAALKCQLENATLFIPDSLQETMDVFGIVPMTERKIWIGARKSLNGTFFTFDGKSLEDNIVWASGQPQNCELCNFVTINREGECKTTNWMYDEAFVCKKKLR